MPGVERRSVVFWGRIGVYTKNRPTAKNMKLRVYGGHLIATESAAFYQSPQGIQQYLRRSSSGLGSGVYLGGTKCFLNLIITKYFLETRVQRISLAKRRWERIDEWAGERCVSKKNSISSEHNEKIREVAMK